MRPSNYRSRRAKWKFNAKRETEFDENLPKHLVIYQNIKVKIVTIDDKGDKDKTDNSKAAKGEGHGRVPFKHG